MCCCVDVRCCDSEWCREEDHGDNRLAAVVPGKSRSESVYKLHVIHTQVSIVWAVVRPVICIIFLWYRYAVKLMIQSSAMSHTMVSLTYSMATFAF